MGSASKGMSDGLRWSAAVLPAAVVPLLGALLYFQLLSGTAWVQVMYLGTKVFTVVWPALALALIIGVRPWLPKPAWRRGLRAVPLGLLTGGAIVMAMVLVLQTPLAAGWLEVATPAVREKVAAFGIGGHFWVYAVAFSVVHAGIEEYYWRWFLYGTLRLRLPPPWAHALAALAFAAHHVVVAGTFFGPAMGVLLGLCVAVGGLLWSVMLARQGTLAGAWSSHILVDLGLAYVGYGMLG